MLILGTPQAQSRMYLHSENPSPGLTGGLDWLESVSTADFPGFLYHISPNDPALYRNNSSTTFRRSKGATLLKWIPSKPPLTIKLMLVFFSSYLLKLSQWPWSVLTVLSLVFTSLLFVAISLLVDASRSSLLIFSDISPQCPVSHFPESLWNSFSSDAQPNQLFFLGYCYFVRP